MQPNAIAPLTTIPAVPSRPAPAPVGIPAPAELRPLPLDGLALKEPPAFKFRTPAGLQAYRAALTGALPAQAYDPTGFLARLGVANPRSSGRTNEGVFQAFRATYLPGEEPYRPDSQYVPGSMKFLHKPMLGLLKLSPGAFSVVAKGFDWYTFQPDRKIEKQQRKSGTVPPDISQIGDNGPRSADSPWSRYGGTEVARALDATTPLLPSAQRYEQDFHQGTPPPGTTQPTQTYGTYAIARKLGFGHEQAERFGRLDFDVDEDRTRYGKTVSAQGADGDLTRHFNTSPGGREDSRLSWARRHLDLAVRLARQGYYQRAEEELGVGLHSLQDMFAHGQITPTAHVVLGGFPDDIAYNPQGIQEATAATAGYLREFLRQVLATAPLPLATR